MYLNRGSSGLLVDDLTVLVSISFAAIYEEAAFNPAEVVLVAYISNSVPEVSKINCFIAIIYDP